MTVCTALWYIVWASIEAMPETLFIYIDGLLASRLLRCHSDKRPLLPVVELLKGRCQFVRLETVGFHTLERASKGSTQFVSPMTAINEFHPSCRNITDFRARLYAPRFLQPLARCSVVPKLLEYLVAVSRRVLAGCPIIALRYVPLRPKKRGFRYQGIAS